jgi:hypothetical protein
MMITPYQKPSSAELRSFGFIFAIFFILVFGAVIPMLRNDLAVLFSDFSLWPRWPWMVAAVVAAWAALHPASLHLLQRPWMIFADVAGWVNTRIILILLFYGLILPIGLIMRLFRYDPMQRKIDRQCQSYRKLCKPQEREHMRHPY